MLGCLSDNLLPGDSYYLGSVKIESQMSLLNISTALDLWSGVFGRSRGKIYFVSWEPQEVVQST